MREAQATFLMVAVGQAVKYSLDLFRYKAVDGYFDDGDVIGTNFWKLGYKISAYAGLSLMAIAALSQLLSIFGVAVSTNIMYWTVILPGIGGLAELVVGVMYWLSYDRAFSLATDNTQTASDIEKAEAVQEAIWDQMVWEGLNYLLSGFAFNQVGEAWWAAQQAELRGDG